MIDSRSFMASLGENPGQEGIASIRSTDSFATIASWVGGVSWRIIPGLVSGSDHPHV